MNKYLKCPKCGFAFGMFIDEKDLTEEEIKDLMTCPCGTMMEETETLIAVLIGGDTE